MSIESNQKLRIGAVSYLNTRPLVHGLEQSAPHIELIYDLPSRLADGLARGHLDVALIPSVEYFQNASYTIVSDACIACRGPVLSVKLLGRVPMNSIRTLALDEGSRTSGVLARILLHQRFGLKPEIEPLPIGGRVEETRTDAVLLIGDRAIHPPQGLFMEQWDLGDEWCRWADLPFVFAMWVARGGVDASSIDAVLRKARDTGLEHLEEIAADHASTVGLTASECLVYLRDNLHFHLGSRERRGLELFRRLAAEQKVLRAEPESTGRNKQFHGCSTS